MSTLFACKLAETKGILEKGPTLSEEVRQSVLIFYEDDKYSPLVPGTNDYVGKKVHK